MTVWAFTYHLCRLIAFSYNPCKFGALENQKNRTLLLFSRTPYSYTQQLMAFVCFCHLEVNDVIKNDCTNKVYMYLKMAIQLTSVGLAPLCLSTCITKGDQMAHRLGEWNSCRPSLVSTCLPPPSLVRTSDWKLEEGKTWECSYCRANRLA